MRQRNLFTGPGVAENYAASRPYFHPLVIERITALLGGKRVGRSLDVACGAGQSTLALAAVSDIVLATDASRDMLARAPRRPGISYLAATAEALPLRARSVELITVALAFHWFDRSRFLSEAHRVLVPNGWLVIYNNFFTGQMRDNPDFAGWSRETYLARFPSPPRRGEPLTDDEADRHGFRFVARETFENTVRFTPDQLARYLMSQTNVVAAVETGRVAAEAVEPWLLAEVRPLFSGQQADFLFGGTIWFLRAGEQARTVPSP